MSILQELSDLVIAGNYLNIKAKTQEAVDQGLSAKEILDGGLMPGINLIGERFARNEVFVPNVLMAAKAMNEGVEVIKPLMLDGSVTTIGTVVVGTVKGDLHDIGKNLVALMMRSAGLEVIDLGSDVSSDKFVAAVKEHKPDVIGMAALLTTTMYEQKYVIEALVKEGLRDQVKVMVGGAPINQAWADKIGADCFAADAAEAARLAKGYVA
ncbi:MAG TPA: cobalamin-binding protein [Peptococcaceae bacterium]|nr:cobalamin-binding protein [Peptococcaceae bacterium]